MVPELRGFALMFDTCHGLFLRALDGVSEEDARVRAEGANSVLWIAAHVVAVRCQFARAIGGLVDVPFAAQFPRGGDPAAVTAWPSLPEVREAWSRVHAAFMARLDELTSEQLAAGTRVPGLEPTILGVLALAALHDSYHVGQLAQRRRHFGLDRLVG